MTNCKDCTTNCVYRGKDNEARCGSFVGTVTNADHIRAMSDEELAAWIAGMSTICECCAELNECASPRGFNRCSHGVKDWLQQPAE